MCRELDYRKHQFLIKIASESDKIGVKSVLIFMDLVFIKMYKYSICNETHKYSLPATNGCAVACRM